MVPSRRVFAIALMLPLLGAVESRAADMSNRLVAGGASLGKADFAYSSTFGEARTPLLSGGGFSLGSVTTSPASFLSLPYASGRGGLAVGGYVAYGMSETRVSSSLRSDGSATRADISAAYVGGMLGAGSSAAISLGSVWSKPQGFSPNMLQPGSAYAAPYQAGSDISLSLSLMRQMTPAFSVGGVAQASRFGSTETESSSGFMLGAGLGYRF